MALNSIPDNDPNSPRWLLDLQEWRSRPYQEIYNELGSPPEYGIISYTWGVYEIGSQDPAELPAGIMWNVPRVNAFSLQDARNILTTMGKRYVWWDWMCVPQGRSPDLNDDLLRAKGQEIGKQMEIYRRAAGSIVWVHRTDWTQESPLRTLLRDGIPSSPGDLTVFFGEVLRTLEEVRAKEPWLGSIWTLQEGVLLDRTLLLDRNGNALEGECFMHNGNRASVIDLTAGITQLAIRLAATFLRLSNPDETGDPETPLMAFIRQGDSNYGYVAGVLAKIMRSGLVAYAEHSPLYILSGKVSRSSRQPEDYCWALLGALDLTFPDTWYSGGRDMDRVKKEFFKVLLRRWQWRLFLVAGVTDPAEYDALSWPKRVVDGKMLPLGVYFDVHWKNNLPALSWVDGNPDMIVLDNEGGRQDCAMWKLTQPGLCRKYEQTAVANAEEAIVRVRPVEEWLPEGNRLFLPIADLGRQFDRPGARCVEIEPLDNDTGRFRGIVDLWAAEDAVNKMGFVKYSFLGRVV